MGQEKILAFWWAAPTHALIVHCTPAASKRVDICCPRVAVQADLSSWPSTGAVKISLPTKQEQDIGGSSGET